MHHTRDELRCGNSNTHNYNGVQIAERALNWIMLKVTEYQIQSYAEGVIDIIESLTTLKCNWAGHPVRGRDDRWTKKIKEWILQIW